MCASVELQPCRATTAEMEEPLRMGCRWKGGLPGVGCDFSILILILLTATIAVVVAVIVGIAASMVLIIDRVDDWIRSLVWTGDAQ
jgi:hypothetical protein